MGNFKNERKNHTEEKRFNLRFLGLQQQTYMLETKLLFRFPTVWTAHAEERT